MGVGICAIGNRIGSMGKKSRSAMLTAEAGRKRKKREYAVRKDS